MWVCCDVVKWIICARTSILWLPLHWRCFLTGMKKKRKIRKVCWIFVDAITILWNWDAICWSFFCRCFHFFRLRDFVLPCSDWNLIVSFNEMSLNEANVAVNQFRLDLIRNRKNPRIKTNNWCCWNLLWITSSPIFYQIINLTINIPIDTKTFLVSTKKQKG